MMSFALKNIVSKSKIFHYQLSIINYQLSIIHSSFISPFCFGTENGKMNVSFWIGFKINQ